MLQAHLLHKQCCRQWCVGTVFLMYTVAFGEGAGANPGSSLRLLQVWYGWQDHCALTGCLAVVCCHLVQAPAWKLCSGCWCKQWGQSGVRNELRRWCGGGPDCFWTSALPWRRLNSWQIWLLIHVVCQVCRSRIWVRRQGIALFVAEYPVENVKAAVFNR